MTSEEAAAFCQIFIEPLTGVVEINSEFSQLSDRSFCFFSILLSISVEAPCNKAPPAVTEVPAGEGEWNLTFGYIGVDKISSFNYNINNLYSSIVFCKD